MSTYEKWFLSVAVVGTLTMVGSCTHHEYKNHVYRQHYAACTKTLSSDQSMNANNLVACGRWAVAKMEGGE